jgi:hypothetical protein
MDKVSLLVRPSERDVWSVDWYMELETLEMDLTGVKFAFEGI